MPKHWSTAAGLQDRGRTPSASRSINGPPVSARTAGAGLAALAFLTYASTLGYELVWDDAASVHRWLPALTHWWSPFFPPRDILQSAANYYRPLQLISYQIDRAIADGAPWPFHLTVVLLHVLATALVHRTALRLFGNDAAAWRVALWAGALFAVHPIHSESVAWMGARPDVMVTCFGLTAMLAYWRAEWSDLRRACVAAALIFMAMLSKENAIALLVMVPASTIVCPYVIGNARQRGPGDTRAAGISLSTVLPFVAAGAGYFLLRNAAGFGADSHPGLPADPLATLTGAVGTYLRLLIVPYPQNAYIADVPAAGVALWGSALVVVVYAALLWRAWRSGDRPLAFSLVWIGVTVLPSLAVLNMPPAAPIAERYLYVPSIGFCWAFGAAVAYACRRSGYLRVAAQAGAALVIILACGLTLSRNRIWRDDYSSWKDTTAKNAVSGVPMRHLALAALARGDAAEAELLLWKALKRRNDRHGVHLIYNNLGTLALNRGDGGTAEQYYRKAVETAAQANSLYNLGLLLLRHSIDPKVTPDSRTRTEKLRQARELLERALTVNPLDPDIYLGLAHVAEATSDLPEARRRFEEALRLELPEATAAVVRSRLEQMK